LPRWGIQVWPYPLLGLLTFTIAYNAYQKLLQKQHCSTSPTC